MAPRSSPTSFSVSGLSVATPSGPPWPHPTVASTASSVKRRIAILMDLLLFVSSAGPSGTSVELRGGGGGARDVPVGSHGSGHRRETGVCARDALRDAWRRAP